jgi:hypothetical protein
MASIDKTYINGDEYPLYRNWWIANYDKMKIELRAVVYLYPFNAFDTEQEITPEFLKDNTEDIEYYQGLNDVPIWNTSTKVDKWLINHCKIQSYQDRIKSVYPKGVIL